MTHYYVGDIPAELLVIEPARAGEPLDLAPFDAVEVQLINPGGEIVSTSGFAADLDAETGTVTIDWPGETVLDQAGLWILKPTLSTVALDGPRERLSPVFVVVESEDGWATLDIARDPDAGGWREAEHIGDAKLWRLLQLAKLQVVEYAPTLALGALVPPHYLEGQLMQARNMWNAGRVAPSGETGGDDFAITPYPLDWMVKQILRPKRAVPVVA